MSLKNNNGNTPRHKKMNSKGRLQAAESWMSEYNGRNLVKGYSRHFGVDKLCAVKELKMLGIEIKDEYIKQLKSSFEAQRMKKHNKKKIEQFECIEEFENEFYSIDDDTIFKTNEYIREETYEFR